MPTTARIVWNPAAIAALVATPGVLAGMKAKGEQVADAARRTAPVGPAEGGHYRDQVSVETDPETPGAVQVRANVPYADKLEAKYRILGSALDAAG